MSAADHQPFAMGPAILFVPADRPERHPKAAERADDEEQHRGDARRQQLNAVCEGKHGPARVVLGLPPQRFPLGTHGAEVRGVGGEHDGFESLSQGKAKSVAQGQSAPGNPQVRSTFAILPQDRCDFEPVAQQQRP